MDEGKRDVVVGLALQKQDGLKGEDANGVEKSTFVGVMGMVRELLERK